MKNIDPIYHNNFGIAFLWKQNQMNTNQNIQLVFRETGIQLNCQELRLFKEQIVKALAESKKCTGCSQIANCRSLLLETPIDKLSFAVSLEDLYQLQDLINGTLFTFDYAKLIDVNSICRN